MCGSLQRREDKGHMVYIREQKKVNEQFGRKMNEDVNEIGNCSGRRWVMRKEEMWIVAAE